MGVPSPSRGLSQIYSLIILSCLDLQGKTKSQFMSVFLNHEDCKVGL